MKKIFAVLLAIAMLLSLAACGGKTEPEVPAGNEQPPVTEPAGEPENTQPEVPEVTLASGTAWNSVADYHMEPDESSVWQYYFFDPQDSSYNPMNVFLDHEGEDIHSWYPWQGSWVGVGFNNGEFCNVYGQLLEQNADGPTGMMSVIGFTAPAAGEYVVTGKLMNAFDQEPDLYTVVKADGTEIVSTNFRDFIRGGWTFMEPTAVTLEAGEEIYFQCPSVSGWVSSYSDLTVIYQPSEMPAKGEDYMPVPDYPTVELNAAAAAANAYADLNAESATEGPWVYALTSDGASFEPMTVFVNQQWDDDPEYDAMEWYIASGDYTGCGINADVEGLLEVNVSDSFANGGAAAALGYQAPAAGTYSFTVFTRNVYEQNAEAVAVAVNGEQVAELPFTYFGNEKILDMELAAGETVWFYGISNGGWVSTYMNVLVNECAAVAQFNVNSAEEGPWVYAITSDGVSYAPMGELVYREWDDDADPDAIEWYTSADDYTGVGFNADVANYLEANVSESFANGGSAAALGFKAPADGTYEITVCTCNVFGQNGGDVVLSLNGADIASVPFTDMPFGATVTVTLAAGEVVYIHGTSNGGWVSAYLNAAVNTVK